jgi:hypothetical protein
MISCSSPEDKATDLAKQLKEAAGTDAKEVDKILKEKSKFVDVFSSEQLEKYNAAWIVAVEKDAEELASVVVSAVKSCDVVKAQEIEKKVSEYKRALTDEEIEKFEASFNERINDDKKGINIEDKAKFDEVVYVWFHPLEKLIVMEEPAQPVVVESDVAPQETEVRE